MISPAQIKSSPHYETLKNSVEIRHARKYALIYAVMTLFCGLMVWIPVSLKEDPGPYSALVVLMVLATCPFSLFYLLRILDIYRQIDKFIFREGLFNQPRGGMLRDTIYFTVEIQDQNGKSITVDTNGIFSSRGTMEPTMEGYVNQTVLLAYNPETERVVVIQKQSQ